MHFVKYSQIDYIRLLNNTIRLKISIVVIHREYPSFVNIRDITISGCQVKFKFDSSLKRNMSQEQT
jgi:hypothetical protein